MPDFVKQLTGKNQQEFEFAAAHIIDDCDFDAFKELCGKSDFLFDFIKKNVNQRLSNAVNKDNYKNLLPFMKIYSPDYEDFIVNSFVKFADEDLTDTMLDLLENGTDEEKAYCAKYFSHINDTLALDLLRQNSYSDFDPLSVNCAKALSAMKDEFSYNLALEKLKSQDEFEKLSAIRFLTAFGDKRAVGAVFETMKNSSMPEHIAAEIPYLEGFLNLIDTDYKSDTILAINHILNGFGEIVPLSQVFDFQLFDVFERLIDMGQNRKDERQCDPESSSGRRTLDSQVAVLLLNAKHKFEQLTENDEYLFDESKEVKSEIMEITNFLNTQSEEFWAIQEDLFVQELDENSPFVFTALELVQELGIYEEEKLKNLLTSSNQTIILKTIEVIKSLGNLVQINKDEVLTKISDDNIRAIIQSLFV